MTSSEDNKYCDSCGNKFSLSGGHGESGIGKDGYIYDYCDVCMIQSRMDICSHCGGWSQIDKLYNGYVHMKTDDCLAILEAARLVQEQEELIAGEVFLDGNVTKWTAKYGLNPLSQEINTWAKANGFWSENRKAEEMITWNHFADLDGNGNGNHWREHFILNKSVEDALVKSIIRILDFAGAHDFDLDGALDFMMKIYESDPRNFGEI